ncbi:unnamed protein product [Candidula unifasciata]|uniref:Nanos-type domain-containing protein n=1 Tax=Candidula unifasciata TaxID=100452 RepID=A0A8S3Z0E9_9EUPU|nr:unnamed protein product [Candidula unifasciata]
MTNAPPSANQMYAQPVFFQLDPAWYTQMAQTAPSRPRLPSDDVFFPEGAVTYDAPVYSYFLTNPEPRPYHVTNLGPAVSKKKKPHQDTRLFQERNQNCQPRGYSSSAGSVTTGYDTSPESGVRSKRAARSIDSLSISSHSSSSSNSNSSSPTSHRHDDSLLYSLFPTSMNEDSTESTRTTPLKTSSPIGNENTSQPHLDYRNARKRRGRYITSSSSEKCIRFSENGITDDLDECDKILIRTRENKTEDDAARKREEFLLILEAERERQRKLVLPKRAPKMNCKFCRNNGESEEVYTKHKLHCNEKTVCPILRHYVCKLCNSTGDFAHTIRHCPFNDRKDKIAWKATFLFESAG